MSQVALKFLEPKASVPEADKSLIPFKLLKIFSPVIRVVSKSLFSK